MSSRLSVLNALKDTIIARNSIKITILIQSLPPNSHEGRKPPRRSITHKHSSNSKKTAPLLIPLPCKNNAHSAANTRENSPSPRENILEIRHGGIEQQLARYALGTQRDCTRAFRKKLLSVRGTNNFGEDEVCRRIRQLPLQRKSFEKRIALYGGVICIGRVEWNNMSRASRCSRGSAGGKVCDDSVGIVCWIFFFFL